LYEIPIMVNSIRGTMSHGLEATSLQSQIFALSRWLVPFQTLQNLNPVKFSSPVFTRLKAGCGRFPVVLTALFYVEELSSYKKPIIGVTDGRPDSDHSITGSVKRRVSRKNISLVLAFGDKGLGFVLLKNFDMRLLMR
jgi:hypothetical protein